MIKTFTNLEMFLNDEPYLMSQSKPINLSTDDLLLIVFHFQIIDFLLLELKKGKKSIIGIPKARINPKCDCPTNETR